MKTKQKRKCNYCIIEKKHLINHLQDGMFIKDIAKKYGICRATVDRYIKKYKIQLPTFNKKCLYCENEYNCSYKKLASQHFCSSYCRERHWFVHNKPKQHAYQKKYRLNHCPVKCRGCGKNIPDEYRKGGRTYCSEACRDAHRKNALIERHRQIANEFQDYKKSIGCQICGYNKCGACLDFHHIRSKKKERRITQALWKSNKKNFKVAIKKCILLCKNCHYEQHFIEKRKHYEAIPGQAMGQTGPTV